MAKEAESNRIIIWRMNPVAWEGDGQVFVGTLEVINCGAIDGLMRVWNWAFKSNNSLDLGRVKANMTVLFMRVIMVRRNLIPTNPLLTWNQQRQVPGYNASLGSVTGCFGFRGTRNISVSPGEVIRSTPLRFLMESCKPRILFHTQEFRNPVAR